MSAGAFCTDRILAIFSAAEHGLLGAVIVPMLIQPLAAARANQQACEGMGRPPAVGIAAHLGADALHSIKGFLVDDRFLGALEYRPLIHGNVMAFLVLEVLAGLEVHCVPEVFPLFQNVHDGGRSPSVGVF